jgi:uncharacterized protein (TIGR03435 family)
MNKLMKWMIVFTTLSGGALLAQDITGTWQGTLQAGREMRTVFKISKTDGGGLKATLYSIDQPGPGVNVNAVTLQGSTVRMSIAVMGGAFEGKLDAGGNSITGTWTQGGPVVPLNLQRATAETAWAIPDPPPPPSLMAADANPVFEVATIKPSNPDARGSRINIDRSNRFSTGNTSLSDLIKFAYNLHPQQISGGPAWLETEKYDLTAKADVPGQPNDKQVKAMLQKLLADRFKLTFHRDKKVLSVYAVTVGKTGAKLAKSEGNPNSLPFLGFRGLGNLVVRNATIADFAALMQSNVLERPVVDQTGLPARFDFTLAWTPDASQFDGRGANVPPPSDNAEVPPDLFTAIQQQLGLKLESTKAPVDVFVIDRVEKPSGN